MKIVPAKCPRCGGDINIDQDSKIIKCEYCNTSLVIEDNKLGLQNESSKNNTFKYNYQNRKSHKVLLIIFAIIILIADVIAIKINWDYENSLGSVAFLFAGLLLFRMVTDSYPREKALIFSNIIGLLLFIGALFASLYIYNLLPGYVDKWESENIKLTIDRKEATVEFKDAGVKETNKYSTSPISEVVDGKLVNKTVIKVSDYTFIYVEEPEKSLCYAIDNKCVEELQIKQ